MSPGSRGFFVALRESDCIVEDWHRRSSAERPGEPGMGVGC